MSNIDRRCILWERASRLYLHGCDVAIYRVLIRASAGCLQDACNCAGQGIAWLMHAWGLGHALYSAVCHDSHYTTTSCDAGWISVQLLVSGGTQE